MQKKCETCLLISKYNPRISGRFLKVVGIANFPSPFPSYMQRGRSKDRKDKGQATVFLHQWQRLGKWLIKGGFLDASYLLCSSPPVS